MKNRSLHQIVENLRKNPGILRKRIIGDATKYLEFTKNFYEDGGIISLMESLKLNSRGSIILAGDGICPSIIRDDPCRAGIVGMLINVNDVVAMGAKPLCALDFMHGSQSMLREMGRGLAKGSEITGVPIIGGHTRLDENECYLAIAMLGHVRGNPLESTTANPGDDIVVAIDLEGTPSTSIDACWVSYNKPKEELWKRWSAIINLNAMGKLTSAKDVSMPGTVGTITILAEASKVGAVINLDKIPRRLDYETAAWWFGVRHTMAYVVTCDPKDTQLVFNTLNESGFTARTVGHMTDGSKVMVYLDDETEMFWDWRKKSIFGYGKKNKGVQT